MNTLICWAAVILGAVVLSLLACGICACVLLVIWGTPKEGER